MQVHPMNRELPTWKRWWIFVLAVVAGLALATAIGATETRNKALAPQTLPTGIDEWARRMPEKGSVTLNALNEADKMACEIWLILELHRTEKHNAAIAAWNNLTLPQEVAVWKWLALGEAATAIADHDSAEKYLAYAIKLRPDEALVYYFRGILRMQQASRAWERLDAPAKPGTRFVTMMGQDVIPKEKGVYELAAAIDFETALQLACSMHFDEALIPIDMGSAAGPSLTVGDFALALGADNFEAKAHNALGSLFLKRGSLDAAEEHMDQAVEGGLTVIDGYSELGMEYRARGQHVAAMRAYLKAIRFTSRKAEMLLEAMRSLRDAFN